MVVSSGNESSAFREDVVTLYNDGDTAVDLTLIRYLDLDLGSDGSYNNDTLTFSFADNTLEQADPDGSRFSLTVDQTPSAVQFSEYPYFAGAALRRLQNDAAHHPELALDQERRHSRPPVRPFPRPPDGHLLSIHPADRRQRRLGLCPGAGDMASPWAAWAVPCCC
jgi:hypothetical protein